MKSLKTIYYSLSAYTGSNEKRVDKFFKGLHESQSATSVARNLNRLLQANIIAFTVWAEKEYKGYNYLNSKLRRKKLYKNCASLLEDFNNFTCNYSEQQIVLELKQLGYKQDFTTDQLQKMLYLKKIMEYLKPANGRYKYRASSTFGELLKNPKIDVLVGDCNQIVTLYLYLYSTMHEINYLKLVVPPGHVALAFEGIYIEATNGTFSDSGKMQHDILPVQEIASINLLDTTDEYFKTHKVQSNRYIQATRLAYLISSNREVVTKNLQASYHNATIDKTKHQDFKGALDYAKLSQNQELIEYTAASAVNYFIKNHKYETTKNYANYLNNKNQAFNHIQTHQAATYFNSKKYKQALSMYKSLNNQDMVKRCYEALFAAEQHKIGKLTTVADIQNNRAGINVLTNYAKKSNNTNLINYTKELSKHL